MSHYSLNSLGFGLLNIPIKAKMDTGLIELIKSIRNRCEVILHLHAAYENEIEAMNEWVSTILEDLHQDSQSMIEKYCMEKDD